MSQDQICQRCGEAVELAAEDFELFERMHPDCFHYAFEHDLNKPGLAETEDCGDPACPAAL
ncbi:hypothetical protein [Lentzea aerocolonigenes]|uniref:hypothetical protein n=1 Tax=Lentzea aerocolonigenes TaxID=68170 RepID=UPI0004C2C038|nr:hypothetical protein [Lentzea aerocolonigenes]MCP2246674.1 hypothetical protein [Lentzea aerocolonigenes]